MLSGGPIFKNRHIHALAAEFLVSEDGKNVFLAALRYASFKKRNNGIKGKLYRDLNKSGRRQWLPSWTQYTWW